MKSGKNISIEEELFRTAPFLFVQNDMHGKCEVAADVMSGKDCWAHGLHASRLDNDKGCLRTL